MNRLLTGTLLFWLIRATVNNAHAKWQPGLITDEKCEFSINPPHRYNLK